MWRDERQQNMANHLLSQDKPRTGATIVCGDVAALLEFQFRDAFTRFPRFSSTQFCSHVCDLTASHSLFARDDVDFITTMPVTTRRGHLANGTTPTKMMDEPPLSSPKRQQSSHSMSRPSPYLLLVYPILLAIGNLYAVVSPNVTLQTEPLAPGIISDAQSYHVNYFAGKRNLVNVLFVKRGWLWTSLAFLFLQLTTKPSPAAVYSTPITTRNKVLNHYFQATIRYLLLTATWIFTTQWFFGPAIIDRSFRLTGGHCEGLPAKFEDNPVAKVAAIYSSAACKKEGGIWRGGHDVSGHVFILVLSSAALLYELYISDRVSQHPTISPRAAANVAHDLTDDERRDVGGWETETEAKLRLYSRYFLYGVVALDCLMLLTTAIWFHTWLEKVNGMLIAGIGLYLTYFLGDFVPAWKEVVGGL